MNKAVKISAPTGSWALSILRELPGVGAEPKQKGQLRFGARKLPLRVEAKTRLDAAQAWRIVHQEAASPATPLLVVARQTTAEARRVLTDHGIGIADGQGNAHLELEGVLIHVEAPRDSNRRVQLAGRPRLAGKAGVAAQALLLNPSRSWGVGDLAKEAGISVGLAHGVLMRLQAEHVVAANGRGPKTVRTVVDKRALLDLWAEEADDRGLVQTPAYVLARTHRELVKKLASNLERNDIHYAATGAAAAALLAPFVTAVPVTELWIDATMPPKEVVASSGGEVVETGNNVLLLQSPDDTPLMFARKVEGLWLANNFRIYRDLLHDPRRGKEQAARFREEVIQF